MEAQLNRAGFRVEVVKAGGAEFGARAGSRDYDITILNVFTDPSVAGIQQFWSSSGIAAGSNFALYRNRTVDAALDSASWARTPDAMRGHVSRAFRQIIADAPAIWLYSSGSTAGSRRRRCRATDGGTASPNGRSPLTSVSTATASVCGPSLIPDRAAVPRRSHRARRDRRHHGDDDRVFSAAHGARRSVFVRGPLGFTGDPRAMAGGVRV
jgi:hypothetical protein